MADFSESDYSMGNYSAGFYSYKPVNMFDAAVLIQFQPNAVLATYAFRRFAADAMILFATSPSLAVLRRFWNSTTIPIHVQSDEYIGLFWDETWVPFDPDNPDAGSIWGPESPVSPPVWAESAKKTSPWIPWGPDMTPNYEGDYNG